jgi:hypothetical protein
VCWSQESRQCPSSSSLEARPAARFGVGDSVALASRQLQKRLACNRTSVAAFVGPGVKWHQGCTVTYLLLLASLAQVWLLSLNWCCELAALFKGETAAPWRIKSTGQLGHPALEQLVPVRQTHRKQRIQQQSLLINARCLPALLLACHSLASAPTQRCTVCFEAAYSTIATVKQLVVSRIASVWSLQGAALPLF